MKPDRNATMERIRAELRARGQEHVLRFWGELSDSNRDALLNDLSRIPWSTLDPVLSAHVLSSPSTEALTGLAPPNVYPARPGSDLQATYAQARARGESLLRAGKVAALTVAGGQGTRLGFDGPKGCLPVTPVRHKSLFQLFAETVRAARRRYAAVIPWYIMTSEANHAATVEYFTTNEWFGLPGTEVVFFQQGMLPAFDFHGRLLMAEKHRVALAPDGHGGSLKALVESGGLRDLRDRGVELISYFQIDNPLVKPFDPLFIGLHANTDSEMSTKVTPKSDDLEPVGNVCVAGGKTRVVEYTDFSESLARERNADGSRRFNAANLAVHVLSAAFVDRVIARSFQMPIRRAKKVVPYVDEGGVLRTPPSPNAVKLETFVFDVLPLAERALVLEVERCEEFSPVKNATGTDSLDSSRRDQIARAARWLEDAGVVIPRDSTGQPLVTAELAPGFALEASDLRDRDLSEVLAKGAPGNRIHDLCPNDVIYLG